MLAPIIATSDRSNHMSLKRAQHRDLHKDLFKPEIGLPEIVLKDGVSQLSDTVLRRIMPPEVRLSLIHI